MFERFRRILSGILLFAFAGLLIFLLLPSPIEPVAWQPSDPPALSGALAVNNVLDNAEIVLQGEFRAPEDIAFDAAGHLYTGTLDGDIYRVNLDEAGQVSNFEVFAHTGGYPLGLHFDANGNLLAAVKDVGLVSISPAGDVSVLVDEAGGTAVNYADELDIARDGMVYFSDASVKYQWGWPYDYLEGQANGRLIAYNPETGEADVLLEEMYFPNGVLLSPDETFLLITESWRYRLGRYWLAGDKAGSYEIIAENLPNVPDNLAADENGAVWVGGSLRTSLLDSLYPVPFLRGQLAKLGEQRLRDLQGSVQTYGFMMLIDWNGTILDSFHAPSGHIYGLSSAQPHEEYIYFGTVVGDFIARLPIQE